MALHKINDTTVLNDEEYEEHSKSQWLFFLFCVGAIISGAGCHYLIDYFQYSDLPKWIRFSGITVSGIIGGTVLAMLHNIVSFILFIAVVVGIIAGFGSVIWHVI
jgi:hypothetical protein